MLVDFTKEKYDILILAGQSNAEGYGFGPAEKPWQPNERVWYLNSDFTISKAKENAFENAVQGNFALTFAQEYINAGLLAEDRKILILRAAVGGTGFLDNHWKLTDDLYLRMMEMIRTAMSLNSENRLVALLWHQGETDAALKASYETHYGHLMSLVNNVREAFCQPNLPFIAGDFAYPWKNENIDKCTPVIDAIRAVCQDCGHGEFVETDGVLSNGQEHELKPEGWQGWKDTIHFSRQALSELGKRYFDKYIKIIQS